MSRNSKKVTAPSGREYSGKASLSPWALGQEGESEEAEDLILPLLPLPNFLSVPNSIQAF